MTVETWYILEDGSTADPRKCAPDSSGRLAHDGVCVAVRGDVYRSRSVEVDPDRVKRARPDPLSEAEVKARMEKNPPKSQAEVQAEIAANPPKNMKPEEPKSGYKTREARGK